MWFCWWRAALIRHGGTIEFTEPEYPFDGFMWLQEKTEQDLPITLGACYIPSASDPRFRYLQGRGRQDHYDSLTEQLASKAHLLVPWILGSVFNAITGDSQPNWGPGDLLDHFAPEAFVPPRS